MQNLLKQDEVYYLTPKLKAHEIKVGAQFFTACLSESYVIACPAVDPNTVKQSVLKNHCLGRLLALYDQISLT